MRITQGMLSNNMLNNLTNSYSKLGKYMDQLHSGKKVSRPSDDPVVVMKGMSYRTEVNRIGQYQRNTGEVHNWMDNSDAALDKATQTLQKMRELAVQASNDTYDVEERNSIKEEVEQLKEHLADIVNTKVNGKYIFNGTNTSEPPYTDGSLTFNNETVRIQVASGTQLQANVEGEKAFGQDGNLFEDIDEFITELEGNDNAAISAHIESIDNRINDVINARADLGARMNRLELIEDRLGHQEVVATKIMSDNEDIHYEEVITDLITQESIHRAALATGSRTIQPTLLDFLR